MRKHSLVTVVAATVAVLLLAGGALAAGSFIITSIKQIKPSVRAQLRGNAGPRGLSGPQGPQGVQGVIGAQGVQGIQGAPGSARAFAVVSAAGKLVVGKNVSPAIGHPQNGIFCLRLASGIDPTAAMATVTRDSFAGAVVTDPASSHCAGQAEVDTFEMDTMGSGAIDEVPADQGFVMLVP